MEAKFFEKKNFNFVIWNNFEELPPRTISLIDLRGPFKTSFYHLRFFFYYFFKEDKFKTLKLINKGFSLLPNSF